MIRFYDVWLIHNLKTESINKTVLYILAQTFRGYGTSHPVFILTEWRKTTTQSSQQVVLHNKMYPNFHFDATEICHWDYADKTEQFF